jgi:ferritin-like metal-binding protein YciE
MPVTRMKELLVHELGDLLYAEQLILKMLGTLTREVNNPEIKARVEEHAGETEEQIERLRRAFESIGEKAKAEKCDAAIGLKEEHDSFKKEEKPSKPILEAFDLGSGLRVEHYEIAGYRSAIAIAQVLGENEVVALLTESLREEEAMAAFLERGAVKALRMLSTAADFANGESDVEFRAAGGGARKSASKSASKTASKSASKTASKSASKSANKTASKSASKSTKK